MKAYGLLKKFPSGLTILTTVVNAASIARRLGANSLNFSNADNSMYIALF